MTATQAAFVLGVAACLSTTLRDVVGLTELDVLVMLVVGLCSVCGSVWLLATKPELG